MKIKIIICVVIGLLAIAVIYISTNWIEVSRKEILTQAFPKNIEGLKIIHLTDLHGKDLGKKNKKIVETIKSELPDMIVLTGDMINSTNDDGKALIQILKALENEYPVFYAYGNHDQYCKLHTPEVFQNYIKQVKDMGCIILDDEMLSLEKNGESINVYGLTSIPYNKKVQQYKVLKNQFNAEFIQTQIGSASKDGFDILLAHDPTWFDEYIDWEADLVLSGHIHGGAIRLPFIGGIFSPNATLFPEYDAGIYEKKGTTLHVSRGLGTSVERIRIFNRPEIAILTLKPSE